MFSRTNTNQPLAYMLQQQLNDEYVSVVELCKSDIENGPDQLALTTVIDKQEQVRVCLGEMQIRVLAIEPTIGVMDIDPAISTVIFGDEEHCVQITCVTGGAIAVATTMKEAGSLIVARTNTTATLRVKNVYTDEMIEAKVDIMSNPNDPGMPMIRYISGVINLTGDPRGMKEIGKHMDICISLTVALLNTPVLSAAHRRRAASVAASNRRCV
jgi:hypothetical protein